MNDSSYKFVGLTVLMLSMMAGSASSQCYLDPVTGRQVCPLVGAPRQPGSSPAANVQVPQAGAHCRITLADGTVGSGTLVGRDEATGLVLTCAHLFDSRPSQVIVSFPAGGRFAARLVAIERANDLAALTIRRPKVEPLAVAEGEPAGVLTACGFGPSGVFRAVQGGIVGSAKAGPATYPSVVMCGAVRPGDSGGAVLNTRGELVGVVWGQRDCQTYATCGRPVREFLSSVHSKRFANQQHDVNRPRIPNPQLQAPSPQFDWQAWTNELDARIRALDAKKQDKGDYLRPSDLNGYVRSDDATKQFESVHSRVESVRERISQVASERHSILRSISIAKVAAGALGVSGPLAAAMVIAGGLAGRRIRSRLRRLETHPALDSRPLALDSHPIAVDTPPPPQRSVPETHYVPVEQDSFSKAHQWASEHVVRKYPGATEVLQAQESLIKQYLAGK